MRLLAVCSVVLAACGGGGGWVQAAVLPNGSVDCRSVLLVGDALFVGNDHGLAKSPDDGLTWAEATNGLPHPSGFSPVEALLQDQDALLAGTDDGIYASMDNAATWVNASAGFPTDVGRTGGLFRSPDQGVSWAMSSTGLSQSDGAISFAQLGSKVFTCFGMTVSSSTDQGQTWTVSASPGSSNCLWLATDGSSWSAASKGLPTGDIVSTLFFDTGKLYAGTDQNGVFVSSDSGKSWSKFSQGFGATLPRVVQFAIHGTTLIAITTANGVWRRPL